MNISPKKRSYIMSQIRSKNTKVEWLLRAALWKEGLRYCLHYKIKGKPDIVFPRKKVAVFIDGDFWHGWNWKRLKPKLKNAYWVNKIRGNMKRDKKITQQLRKEGWKVIRIWEHTLRKDASKPAKMVKKALSKRQGKC